MTNTITSETAYQRHRELLRDCILQLNQFTQGKIIDFGENGFEDTSSNDICGIDDNYVYFDNFGETYSIHEIDLLDAIKIIGDLELTPHLEYITLPIN